MLPRGLRLVEEEVMSDTGEKCIAKTCILRVHRVRAQVVGDTASPLRVTIVRDRRESLCSTHFPVNAHF